MKVDTAQQFLSYGRNSLNRVRSFFEALLYYKNSVSPVFLHKVQSLFKASLLCASLFCLSQCSSDGEGGGGGGSGPPSDPPIPRPIYFWVTGCVTPGHMQNGTTGNCGGSQEGVTGADAICTSRVAMDASSLSSEYSEHRAMLNRRGGAGPEHPRDLDIPNKEN